jgi:glycosyltransferase involved in cell wall biosynthesis
VRILEVVVRFHPYVGGVENTVLEVGRRLAARGHEVRVVCADEPAGGPPRVDGMEVLRLPWRGKIGNTNVCPGLRAALRSEPRPDVIHTHLPTALFADAAAGLAKATGVPLVLTYHNDLVGDGLKGVLAGVYNRLFLPRLLARSRRIVVTNPIYPSQSPHLTEGDPKIICIPWGVDAEVFRPLSEAPPESGELVVGFLSLLDAHHGYKGLDVLLQAAARLRREGVPVRLKIGGAGEARDDYRRRATELGLAEAADFLGFIPAADLNAFYASCHVFALPSTDGRREGFGLVLLEAMACGRPVVTTPVVGVAGDLEGSGAGLLVPPGDAEALAGALRSLHETRSALPERGRNARRLVERRYTWERVADDYEALFGALSGSLTTSSSK